MGVPSYDVAVLTSSSIDLDLVVRAAGSLTADLGPKALLGLELFARTDGGDLAVLFHFSFGAYSGALRKRLEQEGQRLSGRVVELALLAPPERERFLARLAAFDVRPTPGPVAEAVKALREKLGLKAGRELPRVQVGFASDDELLAAYARYVAEGTMFLAGSQRIAVGSRALLLFVAPGLDPLSATAEIVGHAHRDGPGALAKLEPGQSFKDFLSCKAYERRQGRASGGATGMRRFERFESCLEVAFDNYPDLLLEFGSNISRGGMFVKTLTPPPSRSRVRLRMRLPDDELLEVEAEVVHVVSPADAAARGVQAGVGLSFVEVSAEFDRQLAALIERYRARKPRVLVADDDDGYRGRLCLALAAAGMEVEVAATGDEAIVKLTDSLFSLDLLVLSLSLAGSTHLLWRIRRLGGEADLRVLVLAEGHPSALGELKGPDGANEALPRSTPPAEVVARVSALLGR
ncbi:MAG: PilZ domain-containing protein [Myxococcaceae bacterium]